MRFQNQQRKKLKIEFTGTPKIQQISAGFNEYILRRKSLVSTDTVCNNFVRQS